MLFSTCARCAACPWEYACIRHVFVASCRPSHLSHLSHLLCFHRDRKKLPFFLYSYIDNDIVVGRGRGGGLAIWTRADKVRWLLLVC